MAVTGGNGSGLAGQVAQRWRLIDPLLPEPAAAPPAGAGHQIAVTLAGRQVARGWCEHWAGAPDSLDLTWGAARRFMRRRTRNWRGVIRTRLRCESVLTRGCRIGLKRGAIFT